MNVISLTCLVIRFAYAGALVFLSIPWLKSGADYATALCYVSYALAFVIVLFPRYSKAPAIAFLIALLLFLGIHTVKNTPDLSQTGHLGGMVIKGDKFHFIYILLVAPLISLAYRHKLSQNMAESTEEEDHVPNQPNQALLKLLIGVFAVIVALQVFAGLLAGIGPPD